MKARLLVIAGVMSFFPGSGCGRPAPPEWPTSPPAALCDDPELGPESFCMPGEAIEQALREGDIDITEAAVSETGVTAPTKLRVEAQIDGREVSFNAKFKPAPIPEGDAFNNSPRREIAAYELQKLFLDEEDWVVPPTVLRCLDLERYGKWLANAEPWPGTNCALGIFAFWLDNATSDDVLDGDRFKRDAVYRYHVSNANVLTALIGHEDSLGKNMMISEDPERPRVFAIDNGLAFEAMEYNPIVLLSGAWGDMRVPVIPARTARRLKNLDAEDLETLFVVAQMERRGNDLVHAREGEPISKKEGVRRQGDVIQWGLTVDEVMNVHERLIEIIAEIQKEELDEIPKPAAEEHDRAEQPKKKPSKEEPPAARRDGGQERGKEPAENERQPVSGED